MAVLPFFVFHSTEVTAVSEHKTAPKGRSKRNKEFLEWMDALTVSYTHLTLPTTPYV